jgi:uncharacterized protein (TIGR00369 family)
MTVPVTIPFPSGERSRLAERWNTIPAMRHLGAHADLDDPEAVRIVIDRVEPHHRGGVGTDAVNGAVIAALCDAAVGLVGHFQAPRSRVGTAQLGVQFLTPLHGDRVVAVGRLVRAGRNLVFARVEVEDGAGRVCARCDGIVAIVGPAGEGDDVAI